MNDEPSDGLFTVKCDSCKTVFPAEAGKCPCGAAKGTLQLDIDKMFNRIYELVDQKKKAEAIDVVFDVFWQLHDKFDMMNDILSKADVMKLDISLMVCLLTQTFKYDKQVPNHVVFCKRVEDRARELGESEERISRLLQGLRGSGEYWKDMEALGAPAWLSGPKPE
jgi:hypothetical protein